MKLRTAQVKNFRCINDSTSFSLADVTCLVGKNESGKTSVLHALERLNPVDASRAKFDKFRDYPRSMLSDFEESSEVLVTEWELEEADVAAVEQALGAGCLKERLVTVCQAYNGRTWMAPVEDAKAQGAINILQKRLPKFLYFASYDRMSGNVSLEKLIQDHICNRLTREDNVFLAFLEFAGTSLDEVAGLTTYEALRARFEAASIKVSKQIFAYWSQNKHLKIEFSLEAGRPADPPPFNAGNILRTRILNQLHEMTVDFDDRSAGFVWFFSFLVVFSQVKKKHGNVIILLDEPGLNLHARAQADLIRFIYEKLRPEHQVIYTTHSPFMISGGDLGSVRTVEDMVRAGANGQTEVLGTKVGDQMLSSDPDTLFPLQGALGYEITQTLFTGNPTLVVEAPSDVLFLQAMSAELHRRKREGMDRRWTGCPAGGADKVAAFLNLSSGSKQAVAVLLDSAQGQKGKAEGLKKSKLLSDSRIFSAADFCGQAEADVEDMLGKKLYLSVVSKAYDLKGSFAISEEMCHRSGEPSPRIARQVDAIFRASSKLPDFDAYFPAMWLIQHPEALALGEISQALDNFEKFFKALNKVLPKG